MEFVTTEIFSYDILDQILEGQKFKINKVAKPTILPRSPKISNFWSKIWLILASAYLGGGGSV